MIIVCEEYFTILGENLTCEPRLLRVPQWRRNDPYSIHLRISTPPYTTHSLLAPQALTMLQHRPQRLLHHQMMIQNDQPKTDRKNIIARLALQKGADMLQRFGVGEFAALVGVGGGEEGGGVGLGLGVAVRVVGGGGVGVGVGVGLGLGLGGSTFDVGMGGGGGHGEREEEGEWVDVVGIGREAAVDVPCVDLIIWVLTDLMRLVA